MQFFMETPSEMATEGLRKNRLCSARKKVFPGFFVHITKISAIWRFNYTSDRSLLQY
jgi:hypothetical protein